VSEIFREDAVEGLKRAAEDIRPRTTITIYSGSEYSLLDSYDEVLEAIEGCTTRLVEFHKFEAGGEHTRMSIDPDMVLLVYDITEERHRQVEAEREVARAQAAQERGQESLVRRRG
jgi:hypothetical protein